MSNLNFNSSKNDYNTENNNIILNNLNQIYHKFVLINNSFNNDNDEYEEFFNRVNFYFSNIIMQLKLKYIESLKEFEERNTQNEKDILDLIMENMILKIENQNLEERNYFNSTKIIDNHFQKEDNKIIEQKEKKINKRKKSRNKQSIYFNEDKDESFKYEIKTYLNTKLKKKMNLNNINISNSFNILNGNSNNSNLSVGNVRKKNNLKNFITHSNLIKRNSLNKNMKRNNIKRHYQSNSTLNTFFNPKINLNNMTTDKIIKERNLYTIPTRLKNSFYDFENLSINNKVYKSSYSKNKNNKNIKQKNIFNLLSKNTNGNKSLKIISNKNNLSLIKKSEYPIYHKMIIKKLNKIHHSNMKEIINLKIKKNK